MYVSQLRTTRLSPVIRWVSAAGARERRWARLHIEPRPCRRTHAGRHVPAPRTLQGLPTVPPLQVEKAELVALDRLGFTVQVQSNHPRMHSSASQLAIVLYCSSSLHGSVSQLDLVLHSFALQLAAVIHRRPLCPTSKLAALSPLASGRTCPCVQHTIPPRLPPRPRSPSSRQVPLPFPLHLAPLTLSPFFLPGR